MRIYLATLALAALSVPAWSFQIVLMSNYLDKLGGAGNGKPSGKEPWKPWKPPQSAEPTSSVPAPAAPQNPPPLPPPPPGGDGDDPVMKAMSDLTESFVENEAATLEALKEISSSMKMLAEQGMVGGGAGQAPPQQPKSVVLPPPVPAMPSREELAAPLSDDSYTSLFRKIPLPDGEVSEERPL